MATRYRKTTNGRRMGDPEAHLLAALLDAHDWFDAVDIWNKATLSMTQATPILDRLYAADLLQASRDGGVTPNSNRGDIRSPGTLFRLNDRGRKYAANQEDLPIARWPFGLDLRLKRKR
jgi:hypothetical protein